MSIIQITIPGTDLESISLNLDTSQVTALYLQQVSQAKEIAELTKKLADSERNYKYASEAKQSLELEQQQTHGLLTALGVQIKTQEEEAYYQKPLTIPTRIALYIASIKK